MMHTKNDMADKFIADIITKVAEMMKNPEKPVEGKVLPLYFSLFTLLLDFIF